MSGWAYVTYLAGIVALLVTGHVVGELAWVTGFWVGYALGLREGVW